MDLLVLPSVDDITPPEEGGLVARLGFDYQDETGVGLLLDMLENPSILKVHFETHDDFVLVHSASIRLIAEFVQVKDGEPDQLWIVALVCRSENGTGMSVLERSLAHDACREQSQFRLVTLRQVSVELKSLTFPRGTPGRQFSEPAMASLLKAVQEKKPDCISK